jgi:hypothetical protein
MSAAVPVNNRNVRRRTYKIKSLKYNIMGTFYIDESKNIPCVAVIKKLRHRSVRMHYIIHIPVDKFNSDYVKGIPEEIRPNVNYELSSDEFDLDGSNYTIDTELTDCFKAIRVPRMNDRRSIYYIPINYRTSVDIEIDAPSNNDNPTNEDPQGGGRRKMRRSTRRHRKARRHARRRHTRRR